MKLQFDIGQKTRAIVDLVDGVRESPRNSTALPAVIRKKMIAMHCTRSADRATALPIVKVSFDGGEVGQLDNGLVLADGLLVAAVEEQSAFLGGGLADDGGGRRQDHEESEASRRPRRHGVASSGSAARRRLATAILRSHGRGLRR